MDNTDDFPSGHLTIDGAHFTLVDLPALFGEQMARLPVVLRLLLENVVRSMLGAERRAAVAAIFDWLERGTSEAEIAFQPGRVLMHDTTSTPALVDIAAMRNALEEAGVDPSGLQPPLAGGGSGGQSLGGGNFPPRQPTNHQTEPRNTPEPGNHPMPEL